MGKSYWSIIFAVILTMSSAFGAELSVTAPCKEAVSDGGVQLRSCSEVLGTRTTNGLIKTIWSHIGKVEQYLYKDRIFVDTRKTKPNSPPVGSKFIAPVCSPFPHPFNSCKSEITTNYLNSSCGQFETVDIEVSYVSSIVDGVTTWSYDGALITINNVPANDSRQNAYRYGAYGLALAYYTNEVTQELLDNKRITVSNSCSAIALDTQTNINGTATVADGMLKNMKGITHGEELQKNEIFKCDGKHWGDQDQEKKWASIQKDQATNDTGELIQAAHYLCAARAAVESAFANVALCEIFSRTSAAYAAKITAIPSNANQLKSDMENIKKAVGDKCEDCNSESSCKSCINNEYKEKIQNYYKTKLSIWKGSFESQCQPWTGLGLIGIGFPFRKRRRANKIKKRVSLAVLIGLFLISGTGCRDNTYETPNPKSGLCPWEEGGGKPLICCICRKIPKDSYCKTKTSEDFKFKEVLAEGAEDGVEIDWKRKSKTGRTVKADGEIEKTKNGHNKGGIDSNGTMYGRRGQFEGYLEEDGDIVNKKGKIIGSFKYEDMYVKVPSGFDPKAYETCKESGKEDCASTPEAKEYEEFLEKCEFSGTKNTENAVASGAVDNVIGADNKAQAQAATSPNKEAVFAAGKTAENLTKDDSKKAGATDTDFDASKFKKGAGGTEKIKAENTKNTKGKSNGGGGSSGVPGAGGKLGDGVGTGLAQETKTGGTGAETGAATAGDYKGGGAGGSKSGDGLGMPEWGSAGGGGNSGFGKELSVTDNNGNTANPDVMLGEDPWDYFSMLKTTDNLFKKVEARYKAKSISWSKEDVSKP